MTVTLVAKVQLTTMEPTVLYPTGGGDEERIAMLTGVIQLVSAALDRSGDVGIDACSPRFMKSDRGVIGYCKQGATVVICEGDAESETHDALHAVLGSLSATADEIAKKLDKIIHKRGKEIGDLWR